MTNLKMKKPENGKGIFHPRTAHEDPKSGGQRYPSSFSLTSALDQDGWSRYAPAVLIHEKQTQCTLYRRLGGHQDRSGRARKISPRLPGIDARTVESVTIR
jgi:hypothetical protein